MGIFGGKKMPTLPWSTLWPQQSTYLPHAKYTLAFPRLQESRPIRASGSGPKSRALAQSSF